VNVKGIHSQHTTSLESKEDAMKCDDFKEETYALYSAFWGLQEYLNNPAKVGYQL